MIRSKFWNDTVNSINFINIYQQRALMLTMRKTIEKKKKAKTKITHKHTIDNIDTHTHTHEQQQQKTVMDAEKSTKLNEYWK